MKKICYNNNVLWLSRPVHCDNLVTMGTGLGLPWKQVGLPWQLVVDHEMCFVSVLNHVYIVNP